MNEEKFEKITYYKIGESDEMWLYSTIDQNQMTHHLVLTLIDNVPEIEEVLSDDDIKSKISVEPQIIESGSLEYIRFIAIKDVAEKNILDQIKM